MSSHRGPHTDEGKMILQADLAASQARIQLLEDALGLGFEEQQQFETPPEKKFLAAQGLTATCDSIGTKLRFTPAGHSYVESGVTCPTTLRLTAL